MKTVKQVAVENAGRERRVEYRLHYPPELSPALTIGTQKLQVLDISENGVRFAASEQDLASVDGQLVATVRFHRGGEHPIAGKVVRIAGGDIAARLEQGFDFRTIAQEHDWVMMHLA
ncbi:MAG: PilZ domain-containing protein [Nevskia sp.]|nr:PilZ domain-containing protein [Nevskia sp.]